MMINILKRVVFSAIRFNLYLPENKLEVMREWMSLKRLIDDLGINCVIDVGANRGQFARGVRKIGFRGLILSFEPSRCDFEQLATAFGTDRLWRGFKMALGDENGDAVLNVIPSLSVMNSLLTPISTRQIETEIVVVRRLDEVLREELNDLSGYRFLLKMDTQGFDIKCFRGSIGCHDKIFALQSEISMRHLYEGMTSYLDALALYESAGFKLVLLTVVSRTSAQLIQEMNCQMRRLE
ncbi:FkbM family methyltransferase [Gammaproteobacteria bacterium]